MKKIKGSPVQDRSTALVASPASSDTLTEEDEPPPSDDEPPQHLTGSQLFYPDIPGFFWNDWKWQFRNRITSVARLAHFLKLSDEEVHRLELVTRRFPISVTPYYLSLIDPSNPNDPVRRQVVPSTAEIDPALQGFEDPLDEKGDSAVPGLVHRYGDRALMVVTSICPVLCRHCTRKREWRLGGWIRSQNEIQVILDYISKHHEIRDVIISGGDPLTLSTGYLENIIAGLRRIRHVDIIRIGSRLPVVLPQRIDEELCSMLSRYSPIWLNTHFNHSREITPEAASACDRLLKSSIPVNNQSVLLKGINDNSGEMIALCRGLLKIKVRPYYLFQCDEVTGVEHLRTPVERGVEIIGGMRGRVSGLAIPSFVVDLPQGGGKVPLLPDYVVTRTDNEILFKNYAGRMFLYRNPADSGSGTGEMPIDIKGAADADRVLV